jgi:hypothetical protein
LGKSKKKKVSNPYILAIITALITAIFSTLGSYIIFKQESKYEYKNEAYKMFLEKIDINKSPVVSKLLNIGSLADMVTTDGEIQDLEYRMSKLLESYSRQEMYLILINDLNILRLYGDEKTKQYCEDISLLLADRWHDIDLNIYDSSVKEYYHKWNSTKDGIAYGYEQMVSDDDRINLIMISKLYKVLINHINENELSF